MLEKILPEKIDNNFPGYKFAAYAFLVITISTIARSLAHMFLPDGGAGSIATIDISVEGGVTIIGMFAQWGLSQLLMAGLYVIVFVRYKSLIPLMYLIIFTEYAGRIGIGLLKPIETVGTAPGGIGGSFIMASLALIFFIFSMLSPKQNIESKGEQ